jgi:hypothetical protein
MKKLLLIVMDGLGEKPLSVLGDKTPLGKANTPNLDHLAKEGICGEISPFWFPSQGYPRSDTAHLGLFGYDPHEYYLNRGPYEATGIGVELKEGDILLLLTLGYWENMKDREIEDIIKASEDIDGLVTNLENVMLENDNPGLNNYSIAGISIKKVFIQNIKKKMINKRNILIASLALILVVGGVYLYNHHQNNLKLEKNQIQSLKIARLKEEKIKLKKIKEQKIKLSKIKEQKIKLKKIKEQKAKLAELKKMELAKLKKKSQV